MAPTTSLRRIVETTQVEWAVIDMFGDAEEEHFKCFVSPTFPFVNATFRLLLAGKFMSSPETTSLILMRNEESDDCALEFTFGLKRNDGTIELLDRGVMREQEKRGEHRFVKLADIIKKRSELDPPNTITVTCKLKLEPYKNKHPGNEPQFKKLKKLDVLSHDFKELYKSKRCSDVILQVKDKEFKAHKSVLIARSKVFAAMFQHDTKEKKTGIITIPDCDPESFEEFLEYLYCGFLQKVSVSSALNLFETSEKYQVQELKDFCCEVMISNLSVENWYDIIVLADFYDAARMFSSAQDFFKEHLNEIFKLPEWEHLMKTNYALPHRLLKELPELKVVPPRIQKRFVCPH